MASNRFDFLEIGEQERLRQLQERQRQESGEEPIEAPPEVNADATEEQRPRRRSGSAGQAQATDSSFDEAAEWSSQRVASQKRIASEPSYGVETSTGPARIEIKAVEVFGQRGGAAGEFNFPAGIAVDAAGILYVADTYNHRIQRITPDGGVAIVGSRGSGRTRFLAPTAVAVDVERSFYVVEQGNARVQKFAADGVLQLVFGRQGHRDGEFRAPMGIFVSPTTREILVADTGNARIQRFTQAGEYIGSLGAAGSVQPLLRSPQSVTCDAAGNIYVADTLANRISRYDPLGRFSGHFGGVLGKGAAQAPVNVRFYEPHALACHPRGDLFIADAADSSGRLVVMTSDTGAVLASIEDAGYNLGKLQRPGGIAIAPRLTTTYEHGRPIADIYLADTMNHRIIRFECS